MHYIGNPFQVLGKSDPPAKDDLPSAADLDAIAEEAAVKAATSGLTFGQRLDMMVMVKSAKRLFSSVTKGGNDMSKLWSLLAAIGGSIAVAVTPSIQGLLSAHPTATAVITGVLAVIMHWLPSPASTPPSA